MEIECVLELEVFIILALPDYIEVEEGLKQKAVNQLISEKVVAATQHGVSILDQLLKDI